MLSVELDNLATVLSALAAVRGSPYAGKAASYRSQALSWSAKIKQGIKEYGFAADGSYAYEVNGLGSQYLMDDANVPSLMSLPYLGFLSELNRDRLDYLSMGGTDLSYVLSC